MGLYSVRTRNRQILLACASIRPKLFNRDEPRLHVGLAETGECARQVTLHRPPGLARFRRATLRRGATSIGARSTAPPSTPHRFVCRAIAGPAAVRILNSGTIANLAISARRRPCAWITFAASRPTREYVSFQSLNPGASYYAGVWWRAMGELNPVPLRVAESLAPRHELARRRRERGFLPALASRLDMLADRRLGYRPDRRPTDHLGCLPGALREVVVPARSSAHCFS